MASPKHHNRGRFRRGHDPRRHRFTKAECQAGFWAAINSIVIRYPDAVDSSGRHMACDFLKGRARNAAGLESAATPPKP